MWPATYNRSSEHKHKEVNERLRSHPSGQTAPDDIPGVAPAERSQVMEKTARRGLDVLLAEDTPANARVIALLLERLGHHAQVVGDGKLAVDAAEDRRFDVILMDVQMPEMDGLEATQLIRTNERRRGTRTPIIALTGSRLDEDVERCLEAGMDGHLAKPVALSALEAAIASVLAGAQPPRPTRPSSQTPGRDPYDAARALELLAGETTLLAQVQKEVLEHSPLAMEELASAVEQHDAARIESVAHRLKSMLRLVAADASARAAERLEQLAQSERIEACPATLAALEIEMRRLHAALRQATRL
jgi:CheY-like chemotaxis protein/HPt (histidine-containing phosphotransfer) domain-containing protein